MNIWKLGCNWGKGQPFFDDFLRTENIILGWTNHNYSIDDIVLIAKGHTIIALTKVIGNRTPITSKKEYEDSCDKYNIEYIDQIQFTKVEWIDLKKEDSDSFKYELQQGIHQVRSTEIQNKAKSLYQKYKNDQKQFFLIPLSQIANWEAGTPSENGILAEVPILQRGLVWEQSQIELLWDSILRGIPIGSLVLCRITDDLRESQSKRKIKDSSHFIIDGQQRCNAITLGFSAFPPKDENSPIIWLDLNAKKLSGTREFLVRLTTLAHPWGFNKSDDAGRLSVSTIRNIITELKGKEIDFANMRRFKPSEIFPFDADCPIPLSILLNADDENFWRNVKSDLERFVTNGFRWAERVLQFIDSDHIEKEKIQMAIQCAKNTKIIALNMPDFLMEPTDRERSSEINAGITNIEHLFQRLNRQGTTLDGEELVYSMMKSYFPEIADEIDKVADGRMPSSKLVQLSIRLALSDDKGLKGAFNVSQIRRIGAAKDETEKVKISNFIFQDLQAVAFTVDKWLTNGEKTWGVPRVLKTGIALNSPDVYCLLLYLAWKHPNLKEETYKMITGIALFIHWFVDDKGRAVSSIYKLIYNADDQTVLSQLITSLNKDRDIKGILQRIQKPALIAQIIDFNEDNLSSWEWNFCKKSFLDLMKGEDPTEVEKNGINLEYEKYIAPLLGRLIENRELLLYAQRDYLRKRFPDYDPARKDLWKLINRPWDFDHILPKVFVKGKWDTNPYKRFCDNWINSNGNLRAWPFIDNRSDQDTATIDKMKKDEYWKDSFIDDNERLGYGGENVVNQSDVAYNFASSCRYRMVRIYEEWYLNFNIIELQQSPESVIDV